MRKSSVAGIVAIILFFGLFQPIVGLNLLGASMSPKYTHIDVLLSIIDKSVFQDKMLKENQLLLITFLASTLGYIGGLVLAVVYASGISRSRGIYKATQALLWISFASGVTFPYLVYKEMTKGMSGFALSLARSMADITPGIAVYLAGIAGFLMFYLPSRY